MRFSKITFSDYGWMAGMYVDDNGHRKGVRWLVRNRGWRSHGRVTVKQVIKARVKLKTWVRGRLDKFGVRRKQRA